MMMISSTGVVVAVRENAVLLQSETQKGFESTWEFCRFASRLCGLLSLWCCLLTFLMYIPLHCTNLQQGKKDFLLLAAPSYRHFLRDAGKQ
jgi:hypothetical protein